MVICSNECCTSLDLSTWPTSQFRLCFLRLTAHGLPVSPVYHLPHSQGTLQTQSTAFCGALISLVLIRDFLRAWLILKTILILYLFAICVHTSYTRYRYRTAWLHHLLQKTISLYFFCSIFLVYTMDQFCSQELIYICECSSGTQWLRIVM